MSLIHAAKRGDNESISKLLDVGVDVNQQDGQTACHAAIRSGHLSTLKFLVNRGADVLALDSNNVSLLDVALGCGNDATTLFLLDAGARFEDNMFAVLRVASASIAVLKRLVELGVDIGALRDCVGSTVLHRMAIQAFYACNQSARYLQDRFLFLKDVANADIDAVDTRGRTALFDVCGDYQTFDILIALGINLGARDLCGRTVCHLVASRPNYRALCSCLAFGGAHMFDEADRNDETPRAMALRINCDVPTDADIAEAYQRIAKMRLDFVRERALQVCLGLQPLGLDALQTCEILLHSCGSVASLIEFHQWWAVATTVKHFRE